MNADAFRIEAMEQGLSRGSLDPDPIRLFEQWYTAAIETALPEPNAMSLCTVDEGGQPYVRTVLLKLFDREGFVFFTNFESRKARQIDRNPQVAALFPLGGSGAPGPDHGTCRAHSDRGIAALLRHPDRAAARSAPGRRRRVR
jgi:pyridoxine/pyridoxamine 5'-phosphate oxidase